jgi:protein disulfide-isomerase
LARARRGAAEPRDWTVLAFFDWEEPAALGLDAAGELAALSELLAHAGTADPVAKARLAGKLLERGAASAEASDPALAKAAAQLKAAAPGYLDTMLASSATARSARATLLYAAKDVVGWIYAGAPAASRQAIERRWLAAIAALRDDPTLSALERLWLVGPRLAFAKLDQPGQPVPPYVLEAVQAAARAANRAATSAYLRHAVIDDAAQLLIEAGDVAGARRLLLAEVSRTDTPWYYQAALADLELDQGHGSAALEWSAKAKASAQGSATRLQWIARDAQFSAQAAAKAGALTDAALAERLLGDAQEFYATALTLPDGFSGRSAARVEKLEQLLVTKVPKAERKKLFASYAKRCGELAGEAEKRCRTHFAVIQM